MKRTSGISLFLIGSVAALTGFRSCLEQPEENATDAATPQAMFVGNGDVERSDVPTTQPGEDVPVEATGPVQGGSSPSVGTPVTVRRSLTTVKPTTIAPRPTSSSHTTFHLFGSSSSPSRSTSSPSHTSLFGGSSSSSHSSSSSSVSHGTSRGGFGSTGHATAS